MLLFILALIVAGVGMYMVSAEKPKPRDLGHGKAPAEKSYPENPEATPARVEPAQPVAATPAPAKPLRVEFFSNPPDVTGDLKAHFFDCLFAYPATWTKSPTSGQGRTFIDLKLRPAGSDTSAETFALSYWSLIPGRSEGELIETLAKAVSASFQKGTRNFRETSAGPTKLNGADYYELKFAAENQSGRPLWGRVLFSKLQNKEQHDAPVIYMTATDLAPQVQSPDDVGATGDLALLLATLRWGDQVGKIEPILQQQSSRAGILFTLLDLNGDSSLTGSELLNGQLSRFDRNGDGSVSREEFEAANPAE